MWFKLAGATFTNNLGTMDSISKSYMMDYSGLTGLQASPGSVSYATDSTPDATITFTVKSGYVFKSGSTVTASGGASKTYTASADIAAGSSFIMALTGINNKVTFTGAAELVSGGGSSSGGGGESITPTPGGTTTYYFKDQTTKGYLFGNVVKDSDTSRTTDYIDISGVSQIGYWGRMGYVEGSTYHALEFYDSNKNYLSSLSVLGTGSPMVKNINLTDNKYANAKYVRASVAQSTYTTAQFNTWYFIVGGSASEDNGGNGDSSGNVTDYFPINEYIAASTHTSASLGEMVSGNGGAAYRTDYIAISGKTTVNYTGRMGTIGCNYAFYDSSKKVIPGLELVGDGTTVTKTINLSDSKYANAAYIVASISRGSISDADWAKSYFAIS